MKIRMNMSDPNLAEATELEIEPTIEAMYAYLKEQGCYIFTESPNSIEEAQIRVLPTPFSIRSIPWKHYMVQTVWKAGEEPKPAAFCSELDVSVVRYEYRHYDTSNRPHAWTEWQWIEPRNFHMDPYGTHRLKEIRDYIAMGYKYQIRSLVVQRTEGTDWSTIDPESEEFQRCAVKLLGP